MVTNHNGRELLIGLFPPLSPLDVAVSKCFFPYGMGVNQGWVRFTVAKEDVSKMGIGYRM